MTLKWSFQQIPLFFRQATGHESYDNRALGTALIGWRTITETWELNCQAEYMECVDSEKLTVNNSNSRTNAHSRTKSIQFSHYYSKCRLLDSSGCNCNQSNEFSGTAHLDLAHLLISAISATWIQGRSHNFTNALGRKQTEIVFLDRVLLSSHRMTSQYSSRHLQLRVGWGWAFHSTITALRCYVWLDTYISFWTWRYSSQPISCLGTKVTSKQDMKKQEGAKRKEADGECNCSQRKKDNSSPML